MYIFCHGCSSKVILCSNLGFSGPLTSYQTKYLFFKGYFNTVLYERELALLVALQGESSWKEGDGGCGNVHLKYATKR